MDFHCIDVSNGAFIEVIRTILLLQGIGLRSQHRSFFRFRQVLRGPRTRVYLHCPFFSSSILENNRKLKFMCFVSILLEL